MFSLKKLADNILYQPPQPYVSLFEAGDEDQAGEDSSGKQDVTCQDGKEKHKQAGQNGIKPSGPPSTQETSSDNRETKESIKESDTGEQGKRGSAGRRSRRKKSRKNNATQEKFAGQMAKDQAIDALLYDKAKLFYNLEQNSKTLEKIFRVPNNKDIVFRTLTIGASPPVKALLVFIDGITNSQMQNMAVLQPLMLLSGILDRYDGQQESDNTAETGYKDFFDRVKEALLPNNQVATAHNFDQVVEDVLNGNTALFMDGHNQALLLETKGWPFRSVSSPQVEAIIQGPQEAFTEQIRVNTALVRKIIHRPSLVTEFIKVGNSSPMQCAVMYLDDLANPDLVREVKRRLESVQDDFMAETGLVEQMIEDTPHRLVPQVLTTERPDRVAFSLLDGQVAIIVDGNPFVMIVPCTFFSLMQSPEDSYIRWPFGSFVRAIRYFGLFLALLLPANYVAIIAYHTEFIPTDLLLAITSARENVPFPTIIEVLMMELSFELIREAGIRIPGTVGTTLGIVGALILGQAAVAANIVSPILIIVIAVTALGSFAIPNYSFSTSTRVLRFIYTASAALAGLHGILLVFFIHIGVLSNLKSFGVPFFAPVAPVTRKGNDYFMRSPIWQQESRPDYFDPLQVQRQPAISRSWRRKQGQKEGGVK